MRYLIGLLFVVIVAGGVLFGFNLGQQSDDNTGTANDSNQSSSANEPSSSNARVLDKSNSGLTKVTSEIYSQTSTTDLILSNNSIQTLPSEMGSMTNVVVFKIDHNILDGSLIGEIRQMTKLKVLDVSYNNMTGMPAEIGQLNNLESLNYSYNNISGLPNELANLKKNLKEFNLTGNPLSAETISRLRTDLPNTTIIF